MQITHVLLQWAKVGTDKLTDVFLYLVIIPFLWYQAFSVMGGEGTFF